MLGFSIANFKAYYEAHVTPEGDFVSREEWNARKHEWLPTEEDKAWVKGLMLPVLEHGKMAHWIAAPARGINEKNLDFEYVRRV